MLDSGAKGIPARSDSGPARRIGAFVFSCWLLDGDVGSFRIPEKIEDAERRDRRFRLSFLGEVQRQAVIPFHNEMSVQDANLVEWPVNEDCFAVDVPARNSTPGAAVVGGTPVIAHHEILIQSDGL